MCILGVGFYPRLVVIRNKLRRRRHRRGCRSLKLDFQRGSFPLLGLGFLPQCLVFPLQCLILFDKLGVFTFLHEKQFRFVSNFIHCLRRDAIDRVNADLDIELCVKEIAVVDKRLPKAEQRFLRVLIPLALFPPRSLLAKLSPVFPQVLDWWIDGFAVRGVHHSDRVSR